VRSKIVTGSTARLSVAVSGPGALVISGQGITKVTKRVSKRGTVAVGLRLNLAARRSLATKGRLGAKVTVRFTPRAGRVASTTAQLTFKKARNRATRSSTQMAVNGRVGR
jgi:hypothetical protein